MLVQLETSNFEVERMLIGATLDLCYIEGAVTCRINGEGRWILKLIFQFCGIIIIVCGTNNQVLEIVLQTIQRYASLINGVSEVVCRLLARNS